MDARSPKAELTPDTLALEWLRATFPRVFTYRDRPLKIGVLREVMRRRPPFSSRVMRKALHRWTDHHRYLAALSAYDEAGEPAGRRYNLRGRVTAKVSAEAASGARDELTRRRQARQRSMHR